MRESVVRAVLIIFIIKTKKVMYVIKIWMKMNICVLFQTSIISALIIGMGMSIWW